MAKLPTWFAGTCRFTSLVCTLKTRTPVGV